MALCWYRVTTDVARPGYSSSCSRSGVALDCLPDVCVCVCVCVCEFVVHAGAHVCMCVCTCNETDVWWLFGSG